MNDTQDTGTVQDSAQDALRKRIQTLLDLLAESASNALLIVPLDEFAMWLALLGHKTFYVRVQEKGGVGAHIGGKHGGLFIQVHTTADAIEGVELPEPGESVPVLAERVSALANSERVA